MTDTTHSTAAESPASPVTTDAWADSEAYYVRLEDHPAPAGASGQDGAVSRSTFHPSIHAQGTWREDEQHMAPVSGVMTAELLRHQARLELHIARLSFEILGTLHSGPFTVETTVIRPGRTIELVEAVLTSRGRPSLVGRAWRLVTSDTAGDAVTLDDPMAGPENAEPFPDMLRWPGGYIRSIDITVLPDHQRGHGRGWIATGHPMVEGEPTVPLVRLAGLVDTANGVAPVLPAGPGGYTFPNVDLQMHLYRQPVGDHLGLATTANLGPDGVGLTSSVLHDTRGPFGRAQQIQTVRRLPGAPAGR